MTPSKLYNIFQYISEAPQHILYTRATKGNVAGMVHNFQIYQITVFPHIVAAATILFWKLECGNYSREESIQGRKLFFFNFLEAETIQGRKLCMHG